MKVVSLQAGMGVAHLVVLDRGMILVDTGMPGYEGVILRTMEKLGRQDLKLIFITHAHFDHYGSAASLRRKTGAKIAIHRMDAGAMAEGRTIIGSARGRGKLGEILLPFAMRLIPPEPAPPDILFQDGDRFDIDGISAVGLHTPGHTAGSSSLVLDEKYVFVGDLISNRWRSHVQRFYAQDWEAIPNSLKRIQSLPVEKVFSGHGRHPFSKVNLMLL